MSSPDGFLLAGGQSSRMGSDKALLPLGQTTFAEVIVRAMRPAVEKVRVIGRCEPLAGVEAIPDRRPGLGPLAGIETALTHTKAIALVVACDLPLATTELFETLLKEAMARAGSIVVPLDAHGQIAPLCAIYPVCALPVIGRLLDHGERRPRALMEAHPTHVVRYESYAHLPNAFRLLRNVNTPDEYARLAE